MKAIIQRVLRASVQVEGKSVAQIGPGILTFLGVEKGDRDEHLEKMISKISQLRIFEDEAGKMNRSLAEVQGEHLIVSQFTLAADCSTGRRPSFGRAEDPTRARALFIEAIEKSRALGIPTQGGVFAADMKVE